MKGRIPDMEQSYAHSLRDTQALVVQNQRLVEDNERFRLQVTNLQQQSTVLTQERDSALQSYNGLLTESESHRNDEQAVGVAHEQLSGGRLKHENTTVSHRSRPSTSFIVEPNHQDDIVVRR